MGPLSVTAAGDREDYHPVELALAELGRYYRHSSVGQRCLGIVHQMNTPLQVLAFQLELLEQKSREERDLLQGGDSPDLERLAQLARYRDEKLHQFRQVVEQLQNFNRSLTLQGTREDREGKVYWDLNEVWQAELELYQADAFYKHQVTKHLEFAAGLPLFFGHYLDFSQSFRNLVDNALEAMGEVENRQLTVLAALEDNQVVLRVGDTGVGIPPANREHLFEPFFTTKADRAGLGLFMVRRLLAPYGAKIDIESAPGETWVTVRLPQSLNGAGADRSIT